MRASSLTLTDSPPTSFLQLLLRVTLQADLINHPVDYIVHQQQGAQLYLARGWEAESNPSTSGAGEVRGRGLEAAGTTSIQGWRMGAVTRFREQRGRPWRSGLGKGSGEGAGKPAQDGRASGSGAGRVPGVTRGTVLLPEEGLHPRNFTEAGGCAESRKRAIKEGDRVLQPDSCPHPGQSSWTCGGPGGYLVGRGPLSSAGTKFLCKSHTISLSFSISQKQHHS